MTKQLAAFDLSGLSETDYPFYVYVFRDVRPGKEGVPVYVGKSRDVNRKRHQKRAIEHWTQKTHNLGLRRLFAALKRHGLLPVLEVVGRFRSEAEAFSQEIALIAEYGRRHLKTGTLFNITDGGEGRVGDSPSEGTRAKLASASRMSHKNPLVLAKIASASREMHADGEFKARHARAVADGLSNPVVRAKHLAALEQIRRRPGFEDGRKEAIRRGWADPAAKARGSAASKASQARPEVKEKHSLALKRRWERWRQEREESVAAAGNCCRG